MEKIINIAIDGPSGAGKSTLAKMAAAHYGIIYVDTGAMYRCIGLYALRHGIDPAEAEMVIPSLKDISLGIEYDDSGTQCMFLNGENVTGLIRTPEVSLAASAVSAIPEVRRFLLNTQRNMAKVNSVIMDGRDIGTVILPNADIKVFLVASAEERARRRYVELISKGIDTSFEQVLSDMQRRDANDSSRAVAPLKQADDAVLLDTTNKDIEQSFSALKIIIDDRISG